jgi:putative ABC transport system substrate-binding protein
MKLTLRLSGILCFLVLAGASAFAQTTPAPAPQGQPVKIAVANFGPHPQLRLLADNFKAAILAAGINAQFDEDHVNFDRTLVPQLLNKLASHDPDLMLTITTPLTQTAKQVLASRKFPIVFAPVTDPVRSKVLASWDHGDPLMVGASNMPDLDATCEFIKTLLPQAKRLGILYNPGDDSDNAFADALEQIAPRHGLTLVRVGVDNANDIPQRVQSMDGKVDAVFVPASSLLQPASAAIASAANRIKLPIFNSDPGKVRNHEMLAAYSVDWPQIGTNAGKLAAAILKGKKPSELAVWRAGPNDREVVISAKRMQALGLSLPDSLKSCNCVVE